MDPPPAGPSRRLQADALAALAIVAVTVLAYAASVRGAFVYDDVKQVLENRLIQRPELLPRALLSDVWAFKGERPEAWSPYWRPVFVLWLAVHWRLFGADPLPWHWSVIGLHALAALLVFVLARRLRLGRGAAIFAALLFALHPAHVESVAWISGATDPLLACFALPALLCELAARRRPAWRAAALASTALALLAKESAVVLPLLVASLPGDGDSPSARSRLRAFAAHAAVVAGYLLARTVVLGGLAPAGTTGRLDTASWLVTLPSVLVFYIRQALWPASVAPTYPLRALHPATVAPLGLLLDVAIVAAAVAAVLWLGRRDARIRFAAALFALPLLPALRFDWFHPEQLVHDRYLYLPIAGLALLLATVGEDLSRNRAPVADARVSWRTATVAALGTSALLLAAWSTVRAVPVFRSELALFGRAVESDPGSAFHWAQLSRARLVAGDRAGAREAATRALLLHPSPTALLVSAELDLAAGRWPAAERQLLALQRSDPTWVRTYELLALGYQAQGRLDEAARVLALGRERAPHRRCSLTGNRAVVLYLAGRRDEARRELESVADGDPLDLSPACELVLFRLGLLDRELNDQTAARAALTRYLERSARWDASVHAPFRRQARAELAKLSAAD